MNVTKDKIPNLVRKIAVPASVGFFFNTMFNVVDTWYAGLISTEAIAALSLSFPVFFILIAIGSGISQGNNALISNALGANQKQKAKLYIIQSIQYGIYISIALSIIGLFIAPTLFSILGAEGSYMDLSLSYMNMILLGTIFVIMSFLLNSILMANGDTKSFRNTLIAGFFLNLILNPWFIYGGFGVPALGIAGIALATIIVEIIACAYLVYQIKRQGLFENCEEQKLTPDLQAFKDITAQGLPAGLNMMTVAVGIFIITYFISIFGKVPVAAYGIATRIEQIALLPAIGLNMATLTIVGQNNGAKKYNRIRETYSIALKYGFFITAIGTIIVFFIPRLLMKIFTQDSEVIEVGAQYLPIAAWIFYAYIVLFVSVSLLQGLKRPMYSLYVGLLRQIIAPILFFWITIHVLKLELIGIWWSIFIITWSAAIILHIIVRIKLQSLPKQ